MRAAGVGVTADNCLFTQCEHWRLDLRGSPQRDEGPGRACDGEMARTGTRSRSSGRRRRDPRAGTPDSGSAVSWQLESGTQQRTIPGAATWPGTVAGNRDLGRGNHAQRQLAGSGPQREGDAADPRATSLFGQGEAPAHPRQAPPPRERQPTLIGALSAHARRLGACLRAQWEERPLHKILLGTTVSGGVRRTP